MAQDFQDGGVPGVPPAGAPPAGLPPEGGMPEGGMPEGGTEGGSPWPEDMMGGASAPDSGEGDAERIEEVKAKLSEIRRMIPGMGVTAGKVDAMSRKAKLEALNMIFAAVTSAGYDLGDPEDAMRLRDDLAAIDPRWPAFLEGLLDSLDPGQPRDAGIPERYGRPSPLAGALAGRAAEDMGLQVPQMPVPELGGGEGVQPEGTTGGELAGAVEPAPTVGGPVPKGIMGEDGDGGE